MSARRPAYAAGQYYHIYNRGAHQVPIFREQDNYLFVLRKMKAYCRSLHLAPIAYCLLPNHYHFLIRQDGDHPGGLLPQRVFNSYSKAYNKRYDHSGTLFEGHYQAKAVDQDGYLLHLCRYIHANPVIHGLVEEVGGWAYSNYPEWVGERAGTLVDRCFVQAHFPDPDDYRTFVSEYLVERRLPEDLEVCLRAWEG
jgi:REP element-mobilizing transposase RayT